MSLKNINEIQSKVYSTLDKEFTEHTIGSLANIGQRFSEPGEGVTTALFGIADIFPRINQTSYIKCHITDDYINVYAGGNDVISGTILNSIDINNDSSNILFLNKPDGLLEYIYKDINISEPLFDELSENSQVTSSYTCHVCSVNKTNINNITYFLPEQYYKIINYQTKNNGHTNNSYIIYKYELTDSEINNYQYTLSKLINNNNVYNISKENSKNTINKLNDIDESKYQVINTYNIKFDSTTGELWLINENNDFIEHDYLNNELHNQKEFDGLNKVINIYNNIYTNNIKVNIFKYLLYNIFNSYKHEIDYYTDNSDTELDVYLPFDYKFNFFTSSTELNHFYNTVSDIVLKKCVNINNNDIVDYINSNNQIVADWSKIFGAKTDDNVYDIYDQYVLYNISIDYNNKIYEIIPDGYYTLPYINKYNHWVINGIESTISATGVTNDTGFIIIDSRNDLTVYNQDNNKYNNDSSTVKDSNKTDNSTDTQNLEENTDKYQTNPICLSPMYKSEINEHIGFEQEIITIADYSAKSGQYVKVGCGLPKISDITSTSINLDAVNFIKSSPVLVISEYKNSNNELYYVTTIWVWDETQSKFVTITNENGELYDLHKLANIYNVVQNNLKNIDEEPGRFLHQQLAFSYIVKIPKQQTSYDHIYPGIQNVFTYTTNNKYGLKPILGKKDCTNALYNNRANLTPGFWNAFELSYSGRYNDCTLKLDCTFNRANKFEFTSDNKLPKLGVVSYQDPITGEYYTSYDYIPNVEDGETEYISQMDLSGLFLRHTNNLNRTNILSIDSTGYVYYSYIGTSYIDTDKSILKIGSYNMNIDLSNAAMAYTQNGKFQKQETLQFDFKNLNIASNTLNILNGNLTVNGKLLDIDVPFIPQKIHEFNGLNLYSISILPVFPEGTTELFKIETSTLNSTKWFNNTYGTSTSPASQYVNITYNFKIGDYINTHLLNLDSTIKVQFGGNVTSIIPLTADIVKFKYHDTDYCVLQPMTLIAELSKYNNIDYYNVTQVILGHNDYNYI